MTGTIDLEQILEQVSPIIAENAAWLDATDGFISANFDILKGEMIFSALVPTEYGGGGATHAEMCAFIRGIGRVCPSTALTLAMHSHLVSAAVANDRAGRPGRALLDKVASGDIILVSTGANDWLDSGGSAERVEGGYRVTAVKPFASGSAKGDILVTSCVYGDPTEGPQVLHFPLPLGIDEVDFMGDWQTMGMRATGSQTIRINGAFVPDAAVAMKRPRAGFHPAFSVISAVALPLIMSAYVGAAEAATGIAIGNMHGDTEMAHILVGELVNQFTMVEVVHNDMIRLCNNFDFQPTAQIASDMLARKTLCANNVIATANKAMEVAGGGSYFRKLGLERLFRDLQGARYHPLPEKRQQLLTGRVAMGLEPVETAQPILRAAE